MNKTDYIYWYFISAFYQHAQYSLLTWLQVPVRLHDVSGGTRQFLVKSEITKKILLVLVLLCPEHREIGMICASW